MLLVAISTWIDLLKGHTGQFVIVGDAQGVLQSVVAVRAKNPGVNLVVAEAQLRLGRTQFDLTAVHWWSEQNTVSDELSRMGVDLAVPPSLRDTLYVSPVTGPWVLLKEASYVDLVFDLP